MAYAAMPVFLYFSLTSFCFALVLCNNPDKYIYVILEYIDSNQISTQNAVYILFFVLFLPPPITLMLFHFPLMFAL